MTQRLFDLIVASLLIWITCPIWLVLAITVRLTSRAPALYRARRVGQNGQTFTMYKLRSMVHNAEQQGAAVTVGGDPRVTRFGRVLRATKLDELPQLLNVLRGDMTLVGPRPEAPEYVALYTAEERAVLAVRPGLTGPSQLQFRHEERVLTRPDAEQWYREVLLHEKLARDLEYVRTRSMRGDAGILISTLLHVAASR